MNFHCILFIFIGLLPPMCELYCTPLQNINRFVCPIINYAMQGIPLIALCMQPLNLAHFWGNFIPLAVITDAWTHLSKLGNRNCFYWYRAATAVNALGWKCDFWPLQMRKNAFVGFKKDRSWTWTVWRVENRSRIYRNLFRDWVFDFEIICVRSEHMFGFQLKTAI